MPWAAPKRCNACGQAGCTVHPKPPAWSSTRPVKRIQGNKRKRLCRELFDREPLCRICAQHGRPTVATIRDHIVPLAEGGQDVPENTQPLCLKCHTAKTEKESKRGAQRWL